MNWSVAGVTTLEIPARELSGRFIVISLRKHGFGRVSYIAQLCDEAAPTVCQRVWEALATPQGEGEAAEAFHAKYARNEVYTMVPRFSEGLPLENQSIAPAMGDVMLFDFTPEEMGNPAYTYADDSVQMGGGGATDLAIFYGPNNLLLNGDVGWVRGSVFAKVVLGMEEMATACQKVWRNSVGCQLVFSRYER